MTDARLITQQLGASLQAALDGAGAAYLLSAFIMASGVDYLWTALQRAAQAGTEIKILTGDYLYVTEPGALSRLADLGPALEVRLWQSAGGSFHPKAYLFETAAGGLTVIVGSSNLSRVALTTGVEWSVRLGSADLLGQDPVAEFMRLFYGERTVPVNPVTIQQYAERRKAYQDTYPGAVPDFDSEEAAGAALGEEEVGANFERPELLRPAQEEALTALAATMEDGYDRALVVLPTGLGKTYLAAIFARQFARVLFVAHREEILKQAAAVFARQLPGRTEAFYYGAQKSDGDLVFASPYTLAVKTHRERFAPDAFDLIVVDEFHHAVAPSYQAILQYFRPRFLLGLTATPDRSDYKDVYALCDGNVAYRVGLYEAVQAGWLASFRYYGVFDPIDYEAIRWRGTHYDEDDLVRAQTQRSHADAVYAAWRDHRQSRTLGFCSSVRQADFLADYFRGQGVRAVSLHGGSPDGLRMRTLERLAAGHVDVVFSVDLLNEGVDVPTVDTILLVRPTESSTVFLQQIGRGLRTAPGKSVCVIVDLIGNYRHADKKLSLLGMDGAARPNSPTLELPTVPDGCSIELDLAVIDLLKRLKAQQNPRRGPLARAYRTLWEDLGRRPTYLELHLQGGVDSRLVRQEFGSYVGMLKWLEVLSEEEVYVYDRYRGWLEEVERTGMSKSYKMVLLQAMLNRGDRAWADPISAAEVAPFFHRYLTEREYRKRIDFSDKALRKMWEYDERAVARKVWQMPMTKWAGSSVGWVFVDAPGRFGVRLDGAEDGVLAVLHGWTQEIVAFRLHTYFERKDAQAGPEWS